MRVFLLPQSLHLRQSLEITGDDYHYLVRVRRVKEGDRFPGTDGRGGCFDCTVVRIGDRSLSLHLQQAASDAQAPPLSIRLIQCLPKARKMDLIVRQATEAGVRCVIPVYSRFSQVRSGTDGGEVEKKTERWRRIARQALQQSGAPLPPRIESPQNLDTAVERMGAAAADEVRLLLHPDRQEDHTLHRCLSKTVKIVTLVVGPEGGLSEQELVLLRERQFVPVTVGYTVLRSETAALYAVAAVQTVIYERQAWEST